MHFQCLHPCHATPHHHHVCACVLVHSFNNLIVKISVVKVVLVHSDATGVRQAAHNGHPAHTIHRSTFNLPITEKLKASKVEQVHNYLFPHVGL